MSRARRILLLTHEFAPFPGGVARYCWNVAAAAARRGDSVTVLAPTHSAQPGFDPPGVTVWHFPGDVFHFRELRRLERLVRETVEREAWDIVHAADWPMIVAMRHAGIASAEQLATLHGSDVLLLRQSLRARLARAPEALARFDRYVCNSDFTASLLLRAFPSLMDADVRVTPLGVEDWWFGAPGTGDIEAFERRIDRQPGERIVLTVARLDERKGHLITLEALARLPLHERKTVKYVCVGRAADRVYHDRIAAKAAATGVNTVITGPIPDAEIRAAYATSNVFSLCGQNLPGRIEGFGLVLLEAAAQGLPAVVTPVHALPEIIRHGQTGWVCVDDAEQLGRTFHKALGQFGKPLVQTACIEHAREFGWDQCARATYERRYAVAA